MIFKGPGGYGRITNILMNIVMCTCLSLYVLWTVQNIPGNEALPVFTVLGFFVSFVQSFAVGTFVGDVFPAFILGQKACAKVGIKNKGVAYFISVFFLAFVMITVISFVCTWMNNVQQVGMDGTMAAWLMVYPVLLFGGYIVMLICLMPAFKIASAVSGFDPNEAPQPTESAPISKVAEQS